MLTQLSLIFHRSRWRGRSPRESKELNNFLKHRMLCCLLILVCLACGYQPARAAIQAFDLDPGQVCLDCHGELNEKKVIHPATEEGTGCAILCHQQDNPTRHQFAAQPEMIAVLCLQCHDEDDFKGTIVHGPVSAGQCVACHNPHAAEQAKLLREPIPGLCLTCHDTQLTDAQGDTLPPTKRLFEDAEAQHHPPFAAGDCGDCHRPHAADHSRLLDAAYPTGFYQSYREAAYALCLNCHDAATFNEPRTLTATAFRNGNLNLHQRHVNKEKGRSCRACHSPHGSRRPHLIVSAFRFGEHVLGLGYEPTDTGGSCLTSCHVKVAYDRLAPVNNPLRTTPRQGQDAGPEELQQADPAHESQ